MKRKKIKILNIEPRGYSLEAKRILMNCGELIEFEASRKELLDIIGDYDALIVRLGHRIDSTVLKKASKLKVIVTPTTGLDHIDTEYARKKGVKVLSLQGETEFLRSVSATAEHTWALLLALIRRIPWAFSSVLEGKWDRDSFRGTELHGKRLGILGLGRLGIKVAFYGLAFGMKVYFYDPYCKSWPDNIKRCSKLNELLSKSDIFSIHIPLNDKTERLIGYKELSRLPRGALLVNTSRGALLDSAALVELLTSGHLGAAALDVLIREHDFKEHPDNKLVIGYARKHNNLLVTPHLGGATRESMAKTEFFMADKLKNCLRCIR